MTTKMRVMLVDDDPDHLLVCALILQRGGYEVNCVLGLKDLKALLVAVDGFDPNVIFMDHNMPGNSGLDATQRLKSDPQYQQIPVVYCSGENDIARLAGEAGADTWFQKPFEMSELLAMANRFSPIIPS
jgi:CheY-like chemotaxis protein